MGFKMSILTAVSALICCSFSTTSVSEVEELYQYLEGTFVRHNHQNELWTMVPGDSTILYSRPLGKSKKGGYWLLNYEFNTAMPNHKAYHSIKKLEKVGDKIIAYYYQWPKSVALNLNVLLEEEAFTDVKLDELERTEKEVVYEKEGASYFVGRSKRYLAPECNCMRENTYKVKTDGFEVGAEFFDKKMGERIDKRIYPNVMKQRNISKAKLQTIAKKTYLIGR